MPGAWQSFSADRWLLVVLRDGYKVPFHHHPPVSLETRELPSCYLGSVPALAPGGALQDATGGCSRACRPAGPGFLGQLFRVVKVGGGGVHLSSSV